MCKSQSAKKTCFFILSGKIQSSQFVKLNRVRITGETGETHVGRLGSLLLVSGFRDSSDS